MANILLLDFVPNDLKSLYPGSMPGADVGPALLHSFLERRATGPNTLDPLAETDALGAALDADPALRNELLRIRVLREAPYTGHRTYTFGGVPVGTPAGVDVPNLIRTALEAATATSPETVCLSGALALRRREFTFGKKKRLLLASVVIGHPTLVTPGGPRQPWHDMRHVDTVLPHVEITYLDTHGRPLADPEMTVRFAGTSSETISTRRIFGEAAFVVGLSSRFAHAPVLHPLLRLSAQTHLRPVLLGWQADAYLRPQHVATPDVSPLHDFSRRTRELALVMSYASPREMVAALRIPNSKELRQQVLRGWGEAMVGFHPGVRSPSYDRRAVDSRLFRHAAVADGGETSEQSARLSQGFSIFRRIGDTGRQVEIRPRLDRSPYQVAKGWRTRVNGFNAANLKASNAEHLGRDALAKPVGAKLNDNETGINDPEEVRAVLARMRALYYHDLPEAWPGSDEAESLRKLGDRIRLFSAIVADAPGDRNGTDGTRQDYLIKRGLGAFENLNPPYGRLEPGDERHRWLVANNAPLWLRLAVEPEDGDTAHEHRGGRKLLMPDGTKKDTPIGWIKYDLSERKDHHHHWATDWAIEEIFRAARRLMTAPDSLWAPYGKPEHFSWFGINHLSPERGNGGGKHASSHATGMNIDLRLPNERKKASDPFHKGGYWYQGHYDQRVARVQLKILAESRLVSTILFNDPDLIAEGLCKPARGHDHHIHIRVVPPVAAPVKPAA